MNSNNIVIENVDIDQTLKYLGYGSNIPDEKIKEYIDKCEKQILQVIIPKYTYKVFSLSSQTEVEGADFVLEGNDVKKHLKGCEKIVFMCVTISDGADRLIRKSQISDMTSAVILDSMASALTEQVCDKVEEIISREFPEYNMTWRFGLGYGDFPLSYQKKFLEILDAGKRIGVCVSDSGMLTPTKSVTCVTGLSRKEIIDKKSCGNCALINSCRFRALGTRCYKCD